MKKILVTGATGQIGPELVQELRKLYGNDNVVAAGHTREPEEEIKKILYTGPYIPSLDVTKYDEIVRTIKEYDIRKMFHLSSILSAGGEKNPQLAFRVNIDGLYNVLEAARENDIERVIVPSSIAAFGPDTPKHTPNDTIQRPTTIYGISKVVGELMGNYYFKRFGLDVRGVRFPGIISWKAEPTAGTTDYAVAIFYGAIRDGRYTSYLAPDTMLPMMYMPDAIDALIKLEQADGTKLKHRTDFNVAAFSFTPAQLAESIQRRIPSFKMYYKIDSRQEIADSWPDSLDDSVAREEWGWKPEWTLDRMIDDMLKNLKRTLMEEIKVIPV